MIIKTNLKGRLRNTNLPKKDALFPLFEAVVNSIHSIDERIDSQKDFSIENGSITINIIRSTQQTLNGTNPPITGFEITDNGIGFTKTNLDSFYTLDSEYKEDKGCRGIGRLLWLKAFRKASIKSIYISSDNNNQVSFDFNEEKGIYNVQSGSSASDIETSISLESIKDDYLKYIPKTSSKIGDTLLEHCLWYFLRSGGAPQINIIDIEDSVNLNELYKSYMINASNSYEIDIKGESFLLTHVKCNIKSDNINKVSYIAANRLVKSEPIQIPGLYGQLKENNDVFYYLCYVSSKFLTENVTPERLGFNISEKNTGIYSEIEVSFDDIRTVLTKEITNYLDPFLIENKKQGLKRLQDFVERKAPRYRSIINRLPNDEKVVNPNITDKDLELRLHKQLVAFEEEIISDGHDLMRPDAEDDLDSYTEKLDEYLSKISELKQSDLANYVTHRKVILDLLKKAIERQEDGKYNKEEVIHKLIMPMRKTSDDVSFDECNLWLINERLAFHNYMASDTTLKSMPITGCVSTKEPDILGLDVYDTPMLINDGEKLPLASITVIEFKRPMRTDIAEGESKNPIDQCLSYLKRVRDGGVKTKQGRPIPNSTEIPGFCYIICDLTEKMIERCELAGFKVTADKMGYYGHNINYNAYIEVISFDQLLNSATERNRAFFDKLGLPSN